MRLVADIPDDLHRRTKVRAAEMGVTKGQVVTAALELYLAPPSIKTPALDAIPKERAPGIAYVMETSVNPTGSRETTIRKDLSKAAQAKGKMGR